MIRCARVALDRGLSGAIIPACAWLCKHPPEQMNDDDAYAALEAFLAQETAPRLKEVVL